MIDEKRLIDKLKRMESIVDNYRSDARQTCLNLICEIKDFINEQPKVTECQLTFEEIDYIQMLISLETYPKECGTTAFEKLEKQAELLKRYEE